MFASQQKVENCRDDRKANCQAMLKGGTKINDLCTYENVIRYHKNLL